MIRIGDFSRLGQISIKTLRYYDQIGLLPPARIDQTTLYRYYTFDQLNRLNWIRVYKDLGFSLVAIRKLLDETITIDQVRGMLRLRKAEIEEQLVADQSRLERVAAWLNQIEKEAMMPTPNVLLKQIPAMRVAALRDTIPAYDQQHILWQELEAFLAQAGVKPSGPCLTLYYDSEYRQSDVDVEVCEPVETEFPQNSRIRLKELPEVENMACIIHTGRYENLTQTYAVLFKWLDAHGYAICGPNREVYLVNIDNNDNPDEYITEIQFPVTKAA